MNPYLKRAKKTSDIGHGTLSERRVAKTMGARLQPASGALRGAKGDMTKTSGDYRFRTEAKSTTDKSMSVKLEWLVKIASEARADGSIPTIVLSFVTPEGRPAVPVGGEWVALPRVFFQELLDVVADRNRE